MLSFQRDRDIGSGGGEDEWGPGGRGHGGDDTPGYESGDGGGCACAAVVHGWCGGEEVRRC